MRSHNEPVEVQEEVQDGLILPPLSPANFYHSLRPVTYLRVIKAFTVFQFEHIFPNYKQI